MTFFFCIVVAVGGNGETTPVLCVVDVVGLKKDLSVFCEISLHSSMIVVTRRFFNGRSEGDCPDEDIVLFVSTPDIGCCCRG